MLLDVWSDIACPWCYIGKRRLMKVVAGRRDVSVRWRAFELEPHLPPEGRDRRFYVSKFGDTNRMQDMFDRITALGRDDGITFRFDTIRAPSTRLAHRAIAMARKFWPGVAEPMLEACFRGHFEEGADVSDPDSLMALFDRHGVAIETRDLATRLRRGEGLDTVLEDERLARELGVQSVPFFVADMKLGLSGAQPVPVFERFVDEAIALEKAPVVPLTKPSPRRTTGRISQPDSK